MKKLNYQFIKQEFENEGYTLLSKEYKNSRTYLEFICPNGHKHKIKWNNWQQGQKCCYCDKYNRPITYKFVKQSFEKEGYKLLSKKYNGNKKCLSFICPNGHEHKIRWNDWYRGHRCYKCYKPKLTYEYIKQEIEKENYKLLSKEYGSALKQLDYICPNGHNHKITWAAWQQGQRCPCQSNKMKPDYNFIKQSFEKEGYQLLSTEYKNNSSYLDYICPNGHKHKITFAHWQRGERCGKCDIKCSKGEKEITEYIKNNYKGIIKENDRTLIKNPKTGKYLELDIWLPKLNKAIEYNGEFWHNNIEIKYRDNYKQQWCRENNINLLVIKEEDWLKNKDWNKINCFIGGCV